MSSHRISASGDRPFTLNAGGGSHSGWSVPSKQTDGAHANLTGFSKFEIPLFGEAKIQRVKYTTKYRDEVTEHEALVLVIEKGSCDVFAFPSGDGENPGPENTNLDIRKPGEKFGALSYYEAKEVVEEIPLNAVVAPANPDAGFKEIEVGTIRAWVMGQNTDAAALTEQLRGALSYLGGVGEVKAGEEFPEIKS